MNITQEQATWIAQNILWLIPLSLFLFTSAVLGFWKFIGKLFCKKKPIPQKKGEVTSPKDSVKSGGAQTPVELNKEGYVDLTK